MSNIDTIIICPVCKKVDIDPGYHDCDPEGEAIRAYDLAEDVGDR